jgi:hypothetical protein
VAWLDAVVTSRDAAARYRLEQMGRFFMGTADVHLAMDRLVRKLDELGIPYAICGGMAVNAHGHLRETIEIDVLLTADGLRRFNEEALGRGWLERFAGSRGVKDTDRGVPIDVLVSGGIPGDGTEHGVVFPDPAGAAVELAGVRYLTLGKLIEMKLASGLSAPDRLQDLADVISLIRQNQLGEHFADSLHAYVQAKYRELWGYAQRPTILPP